MTEFKPVADASEVPVGKMKRVQIGKLEIAIYNIGGRLFATDDVCTHAYASLSEGFLEGEVVECPLHGGTFNVTTGKATAEPCTEDLKTYPIKVEGSQILIGIPTG
jgi:nitrite reductase/ring-hydroxylating ferredoxin subunit